MSHHTLAHDSAGGSAAWCNECQGYKHAPWCSAYVDRNDAEPTLTEEEVQLVIGAIPLQALPDGPVTTLQRAVMEADDDIARLDRNGYHAIEQSAIAIRSRRPALLERATPDALTEGALALAEAWLDGESWYQQLSNNAMQDAVVLELAGEIESAVESYLAGQREG